MQQHLQQQALQQQMMTVAKAMEDQVDAEMKRLDTLEKDEDALERIRERRLKDLKKMADKRAEWKRNGHGSLNEINSDRDFLDATKGSKKCVIHFYRNTTMNCKVLDKHLQIIAQNHLETKFLKVDVEKCDWLVKRLNVRIIPTTAILINGAISTYIRGFDGFGDDGKDFPTEMLEWRLGQCKAIAYKGDLNTPPGSKPKSQNSTKIVRESQNEECGGYSDHDSDGLDDL